MGHGSDGIITLISLLKNRISVRDSVIVTIEH